MIAINLSNELYTVKEAAKLCSMSIPTIYKLSKQKKLVIKKIGTCSRIHRSEIERMINDAPTLH